MTEENQKDEKHEEIHAKESQEVKTEKKREPKKENDYVTKFHKTKHKVKPAKKKDNDTIKINKVLVWQIISAILVIALVATNLDLGGSPSAKSPSTSSANVDTQETTGDGTGLIDDDSIKGDLNAPVTIVEWTDYECPFCARFYEQAYQQILSSYVNTGKVKIVVRDFPLSFHKNAQKAAEAAECAGEQGNYYDMHDLLFEKGVSGGVSSFKKYAVDLGLDTEAFNECLDSDSMAAEVAADMQAGIDNGIRGTPGFIINGEVISGAQPFSAFQEKIEAALAE